MYESATSVAMLLHTEHRHASAMTAMSPSQFGRRLGGVRFVSSGSVEEVVHLANGMSDKCAASRIPMDGQKALIVCPGGVPAHHAERAAILASHLLAVVQQDSSGVFGPDMYCGSDVLDQLAGDPRLSDHVTGLSEAANGMDINARALTARSVLAGVETALERIGLSAVTASIQGFGAVGAPLALMLEQRGHSIVVVSNVRGTLHDREGIDVARLYELWNDVGEHCLERYREGAPSRAQFVADPQQVFRVQADLFIPAARTMALSCHDELGMAALENPHVMPVEVFADHTRCKIVAQAANHPMSSRAEEHLARRGVTVLTDVLINIGGMVGCYAEWRYRGLIRNRALSVAELAERCSLFAADAVRANIADLLDRDGPPRSITRDIVRMNRLRMAGVSSTADILDLDSSS